LTWQNKKWELSCDFLVQVILIFDYADLYTFQCPTFLRSLSLLCDRCWYTYCLSIYCGMGGRMLKPCCLDCEQYRYCVFHKVPSLSSSPSVQTTLYNTQRAQWQILTGCTMTCFWKNCTNFDSN
jgi:hypothetical protein